LLANIRLEWKGLVVPSTLAYYGTELITSVKKVHRAVTRMDGVTVMNILAYYGTELITIAKSFI
jgi:hypothetical protein